MDHIVNIIKETLNKNKSEKSKEFWSKYMKNEIEFIGVGIPEIRKIIKNIVRDEKIIESDDFILISKLLMKSNIAEHKLASILIIQLYLFDNISDHRILDTIEDYFDKKLIFDWNTCDWLCVKILTPILDHNQEDVIRRVVMWSTKDYLWYARASLVPFAQSKIIENYLEDISNISRILISREERFSKTAVGWVMREISRFDKEYVSEFIMTQKNYVTNEVVNNSMKYFSKDEKKDIKEKLKNNN